MNSSSSKKDSFISGHFFILTSVLSAILALLYFWKGIRENFTIGAWLIIGMNLVYIPTAFLFKKKGFLTYCIIYSAILVFLLAFTETCLYNNYSALFIICIVISLKPELEKPCLLLYLACICVAFALNEECLYHFFIHSVRSTWFVLVAGYIVDSRKPARKLILYKDEEDILRQLSDGNRYQKEVQGYSENTVYRKLKSARERNGCITRDQLVEQFRQEYLAAEGTVDSGD